jgi:hypothetical protein
VKGNSFDVFRRNSREQTNVARGDASVPPPDGDPLLIDPRREDPAVFMYLDLMYLDCPGTFSFLPMGAPETEHLKRAEYTIEMLKLNARDTLRKARAGAYKDFRAHLSQYCADRARGASQLHLQELIHDIRTHPHPTVWREMKRQKDLLPDLKALFEAVPEALDW